MVLGGMSCLCEYVYYIEFVMGQNHREDGRERTRKDSTQQKVVWLSLDFGPQTTYDADLVAEKIRCRRWSVCCVKDKKEKNANQNQIELFD